VHRLRVRVRALVKAARELRLKHIHRQINRSDNKANMFLNEERERECCARQ
jgi:hypothetical protein